MVQPTIHQFKVEKIDGGEIDFAAFQGKKIIVVNVASECGFTPQYRQLQELFEKFQEHVVVVGFPANNFGGQEPGTDEEIRAFCTSRFGVTFPLSAKIDIHREPVYAWLTQRSLNGVADSQVRWNFQKYLLDEHGHLVRMLPSSTEPFDDEILSWITA
ncbi:MAG: glutathione peroxidase [Saprospiraceae bacterium]|nr:glutathione peroxidase [Saprospiraceae bacterium]MCB0623526.1 glutathione peroxidase [Saprospiraceae bacterium]MCB0676671.1 glutathione peroxidase [Saprospiraceae bacterium]MCB0683483.1 glutathione peroxidase [Saprospiraceae bacterium]